MTGIIKREGKRILLSAIHKAQAKVEMARVAAELQRYSTEVIQNEKPQKKKSILFLVTRMVRFHGGQTFPCWDLMSAMPFTSPRIEKKWSAV